MIHEYQLTRPLLEALNESLLGELTTTELRRELKERLPLDSSDFAPLKNRSDHRIDQIIRNLKSHKCCSGNPVAERLVEEVPRGFRITKRGLEFLKGKPN